MLFVHKNILLIHINFKKYLLILVLKVNPKTLNYEN